jgi:ribosomal protein S12 methylthiotransferase accessory factor
LIATETPRSLGSCVILRGDGLLTDAIARRLPELDLAVRVACPLVVAVNHSLTREPQLRLHAECRAEGCAWLGVQLEPGQVAIGPLSLPDAAGCEACVESRRLRAAAEPETPALLRADPAGASRSRWLIPLVADLVAELVAAQVTAYLEGSPSPHPSFTLVKAASLAVSRHRFLPDPLCTVCAAPVADGPEAGQLRLSPRPKADARSLRIGPIAAADRRLRETYVDSEAGVVKTVALHAENVFCNAFAVIGLDGRHRVEVGYGRALDYATAESVALVEALERYGGMRPIARRTAVTASFAELDGQALDPSTLGLAEPGQYDGSRHQLVDYRPDLPVRWVWGFSFQRRRPVLVPERCAYYGLHWWEPEDPFFLFEISNGCAVGSCLEEAILHGLLEVVERDSFLLTWYARMPVPRVDLRSARSRRLRLMVDRLEHATGYTVHAFNVTLEHGIPSFWVMAVDEQNRPGKPKAAMSAGAHLDPEQALEGAVHELDTIVGLVAKEYRREAALRLLRDPAQVREMADHSQLYALPEAFERLRFLFNGSEVQSLDTAFPRRIELRCDLRDDLLGAVERILGVGLDVVVVRTTTPEHERCGLETVKVLVPGMVPVTFGHFARRIAGLDRILTVPHRLGYRSRPLVRSELNEDPHPFP